MPLPGTSWPKVLVGSLPFALSITFSAIEFLDVLGEKPSCAFSRPHARTRHPRRAFLLFSAKMKFFDVLDEKPSQSLSGAKILAESQPNAGFIALSVERSCTFSLKSPSGSVH
jgi:hypothetical protein